MDAEGYRAAFRGSAIERAKLPAMKRDAAVVPASPSLGGRPTARSAAR